MYRLSLGLLALSYLIFASPCTATIDFSIAGAAVTDNLITTTASLSGTTTNYYLQGALRSQGSSKYFGETLGNQGTYLDYISSPEKEFISSNFMLTSVQNASWSGELKMRYKVDDPLYLGPGTYELKLRRFTGGSSSAAGESNTLLINLTLPLPTPSPSLTPNPATSAKPDSSPSPTVVAIASATATPTSTPTPLPSPTPSPQLEPSIISTVQGESTERPPQSPGQSVTPATSENPPVVNPSRLKIVLGVGTGFLSLGTAIFLYLRKRSFASIINE